MSTLGRQFHKGAYLTLKGAQRRLNKAVGGLESGASITRVDYQRLSRYGSPNEALFAPVDVVADLEADAGEPIVTKALAALNGHLVIPKPPADGDPKWVEHLGALGKEAGEAMARLAEAFAQGGTITAEESKSMELRREVAEAMEVLARIDKALERIEDENGAGAEDEV